MLGRSLRILAAVALVLGAGAARAADADRSPPRPPVPTVVAAADWALWRAAFLAPGGRVVDVERRGVSGSTGQGYGLLLAVFADDRTAFDAMLDFTLTHLRLRPDRLFNRAYDPVVSPARIDRADAADGDILVAYALVLAAVRWEDRALLALAEPIVADAGRLLLEAGPGGLVAVRPAASPLAADDPDGPVLNLAHYVYGAFGPFAAIDPDHPWDAAWRSGLRFTDAARAGPLGLVPDWTTLARRTYLGPAVALGTRSSVEAVRIPLHMALGGGVPARHFAPFDEAWNGRGDGAPFVHDLVTGRTLGVLDEPGHRAVAALAACAARGVPMPAELVRYRTTTYAASTLHLLALAAARWHYPGCADGPVAVLRR